MRFLMLNWRDPKNPLAGGAERVTMGYLSALRKRGHEVYWFSFDFPGAAREEELEGVRIVRGGGIGTAIIKAVQWCRTQPRFDLVVDQHHGIPWFAPWWCRTNSVAYIHEVLGPIWNSFYSWPWSTFGRWQERWTHFFYRNVPFWTACTSTREALHQHGVRRIQMIPYGVHTVALPRLEPKPLAAPLRLAVVSRLAPNKRIEHAILTVKELLAQGIDAHLTIVGSGEEEGRLKELVQKAHLGKYVRFTGPLPEVEKDTLLKEAHYLLHTSQREGWGLNVIEANAMGTPAAVYPVAGLIESTLHDETGLVAEAETPQALARSLIQSLNNPERYQVYREKGWERAKTFHWNVVLPQACDWLEAMAAGGKAK